MSVWWLIEQTVLGASRKQLYCVTRLLLSEPLFLLPADVIGRSQHFPGPSQLLRNLVSEVLQCQIHWLIPASVSGLLQACPLPRVGLTQAGRPEVRNGAGGGFLDIYFRPFLSSFSTHRLLLLLCRQRRGSRSWWPWADRAPGISWRPLCWAPGSRVAHLRLVPLTPLSVHLHSRVSVRPLCPEGGSAPGWSPSSGSHWLFPIYLLPLLWSQAAGPPLPLRVSEVPTSGRCHGLWLKVRENHLLLHEWCSLSANPDSDLCPSILQLQWGLRVAGLLFASCVARPAPKAYFLGIKVIHTRAIMWPLQEFWSSVISAVRYKLVHTKWDKYRLRKD